MEVLAAEAVSLTVPAAGGREVRLLQDVTLRVQAGEMVALVGPNGAGKTTLLRLLGGLLPPSGGQVLLRGRPLGEWHPRQRARELALVPQNADLGAVFACLEVVLMGRYPYLRRFQRESAADLASAGVALAEAELAQRAQDLASTLSSGERQRLLFARARCQGSPTLLCDEPTANLDLRHRALLMDVLQRCSAAGGTVVAAIHDLELAARHCPRMVLLAGGRLVADGRPEEVLTPEHLRAHFGVEAEITHDAGGAVRLSVLGPAG